MIGTMKTPEGELVEIDFNMLFQDEIVKRRLLEEEVVIRGVRSFDLDDYYIHHFWNG